MDHVVQKVFTIYHVFLNWCYKIVPLINGLYKHFLGTSKAPSQWVLKKYLLIILFLDKAKLTRLIDYDPCLFHASSSIKVSTTTLSNNMIIFIYSIHFSNTLVCYLHIIR